VLVYLLIGLVFGQLVLNTADERKKEGNPVQPVITVFAVVLAVLLWPLMLLLGALAGL
jgi:hypothetical protein